MALHLCYAALRLEAGGTHSECPGTQIPRLRAALGSRRKRWLLLLLAAVEDYGFTVAALVIASMSRPWTEGSHPLTGLV